MNTLLRERTQKWSCILCCVLFGQVTSLVPSWMILIRHFTYVKFECHPTSFLKISLFFHFHRSGFTLLKLHWLHTTFFCIFNFYIFRLFSNFNWSTKYHNEYWAVLTDDKTINLYSYNAFLKLTKNCSDVGFKFFSTKSSLPFPIVT